MKNVIELRDVPALVKEYKGDPNCRPLLWIEGETKDPEIIQAFLKALTQPAL